MPPSKYQPLADFLVAQPPEVVSVTLTLPEIDVLLGQPLPRSAHSSGWWWNTLEKPHAQAWMDSGWRVVRAQVRQTPSAVTFARVSPATPPPVGD